MGARLTHIPQKNIRANKLSFWVILAEVLKKPKLPELFIWNGKLIAGNMLRNVKMLHK